MARPIIRTPNHLGDVIMALPAIEALQPADVMLPGWIVPVIELAGIPGEAVAFERGTAGMLPAARTLRQRGYRRGILMAPSFSSALIFVLGGVRERRGATTDGRRLLIGDPVPDAAMAGLHRSATFHVLGYGRVPDPLPAPRLSVPAAQREAWQRFARASAPAEGQNGTPATVEPALPAARGATWAHGFTVGIFPGSNGLARRWDLDRFAEVGRLLAAAGARIVVFGSERERELTDRVVAEARAGLRARPLRPPAAAGADADGRLDADAMGNALPVLDAGGRTDLPLLAAGLAACDLLVTNDSGPMHLAAAVGTRTVSMQGPSDPGRTGPLGDGHVLLQHPELACVPCIRNACPRHGPGTFLPEAERECLRLIEVADVVAAVRASLAAGH
jgi:ADP-heptose:LPS heptosyltransferase